MTRSVSLGGDYTLTLAASVLHLRGNAVQAQPYISERGDILCWNGEASAGCILGIAPTENDGAKLFAALSATSSSMEVVEIFAKLEGPYAFVFYSAAESALYFGRDPLGRRSLLVQHPTTELPVFALSSASAGHETTPALEELSTERIFRLDFNELRDLFPTSSDFLTPLPRIGPAGKQFCLIPTVNLEVVAPELPVAATTPVAEDFMHTVSDFIAVLDSSVRLRVQDIPPLSPTTETLLPDEGPPARVAVLFSGGIDSSMVAFLADRHVPPDEPIDLLNVAFENPRKLRALQEPQQPRMHKRKKLGMPQEPIVPSYMVPDRVTGLEELEELRSLRPARRWNFVEVNVDYQECTRLRPDVEALMHPSKTIMDLSLALALYFASRGQGTIKTHEGGTHQYRSRARVILSGLGSDELLGGYGRHKTAYLSGGWPALLDELQLELSRIPTRNMGRDDRIISSHGKEARYPFLSLSVVNFLASLPVHLKVDPRMGDGAGDKMLLRAAARQLGLVCASSQRKRAMQFGSQSARMEEGASRRGDVNVAPARKE
ncbi:hypothetical protein AURDEDRAFT_78144 [Auricularia subglabra TFB-10046 SS5]|nr:hypothetical protein AURDEDRAFT_78144 [Auricularia subglabra TFB-10046 SS5]